MGYVALSRVTSLSGLYLKDFNGKYIYCDKYIDTELQKMHQIILKDTLPLLHHPSTFINIIYHNVQGLSSKFRDIISNTQMMLADCICISESWLTIGQLNPEIPGFTMDCCHRFSGEKGVAMYIKDHFSYQKVMLTVQGIEALALKIPALDLVVCVLYRPPRMTKAIFQLKLDKILDQLPPVSHTIVGGDFNENIMDEPQKIPFNMHAIDTQLINQPTTRYGNLLDHIYVRQPSNLKSFNAGVLSTY